MTSLEDNDSSEDTIWIDIEGYSEDNDSNEDTIILTYGSRDEEDEYTYIKDVYATPIKKKGEWGLYYNCYEDNNNTKCWDSIQSTFIETDEICNYFNKNHHLYGAEFSKYWTKEIKTISLNKHSICGEIRQCYAEIIYSFEFENLRESMDNNGVIQSDELKYVITINPDAFISGFTANIDGELFHGQTKEKETADIEYVAAKKKNENAILISQLDKDIQNIFEIKTNINAQSKISLDIKMEQYLQKKFNLNELNIQILNDFDKYTITKNYDFIGYTFNVYDKRGIYNIGIPSLYPKKKKTQKQYIINGKIIEKMDELILKYKVGGESNEFSTLFDKNTKTFCHIISKINDTVSNNDGGNILIPRRIAFIVDKSGSMNGIKWDYCISSLIRAVKKLKIKLDRFCIIFFDDEIEIFTKNDKTMMLATDNNINAAIEFINNQNYRGSTDINSALLKGIDIIKNDIKWFYFHNNNGNVDENYNYFLNQIIFITDGEPTVGECDPKQILLNINNANDLSKINKYSSKILIFCFGIGEDNNDRRWINDLNHGLLKLISMNNNGFYKRIKKSYADNELNQYFDILSQAIFTNIKIKYDNKNIINLTETQFNTLYLGNELIICGQLKKNNKSKYLKATISATTISATTGNRKPIKIKKNIFINLLDSDIIDNDDNNINKIWAYLRLQQYAKNKIIIHNDMIEIDDDEKKEINDNLIPLQLAMKYNFVTPWTSMIVVKEKNYNNDEDDKFIKDMMNSINDDIYYDENQLQTLTVDEQVQDIINSLNDDNQTLTVNEEFQELINSFNDENQTLRIRERTITMEENDRALEKAMEQYAQLTCPWRKEIFVIKKKRNINDELLEYKLEDLNCSRPKVKLLDYTKMSIDDIKKNIDEMWSKVVNNMEQQREMIMTQSKIDQHLMKSDQELYDKIYQVHLKTFCEPIFYNILYDENKKYFGIENCGLLDIICLVQYAMKQNEDELCQLYQYNDKIDKYLNEKEIDGEKFVLLIENNQFILDLFDYIDIFDFELILLLRKLKESILNLDFETIKLNYCQS